MRRLAAIAAVALALSGVAAPAMAAESVPNNQAYSLNDAPVDPSPSHHKIKPPAPGKGDLFQLFHGGFDNAASAASTDSAAYVPTHSAAVLLKSGVVVAKIAKAKALKQPKQAKQPKQKTAKTTAPAKTATTAKTTKATKVVAPTMTPQQAQQYAFQFPPRVRPKVRH